MKKWMLLFIAAITLAACNQKKVPDVSNIIVDLKVERFEQDFFAFDTTHIDQAMQKLHKKYPGFLQDFLYNILALTPQPDSSNIINHQISLFFQSYKPLKDSADLLYKGFDPITADIRQGFQFVKFYFPDYKLPSKVVTFIGPLDSYGNILTSDAVAVGLQLYMGSNYSWYQSEAGQALYPAYISRRFSKEYIAVNCLKTIVNDIMPDNSAGKPLIEQMVQEGKRLYILDKLMPYADDTLKTGYTQAQLNGCYKNEQTIYSFFVQNELLFNADPSVTKDYMNDAPQTQVFGKDSPGFIGQFTGWQIVKKWMSKHEELSLQDLINTDPKQIFNEAKYKP